MSKIGVSWTSFVLTIYYRVLYHVENFPHNKYIAISDANSDFVSKMPKTTVPNTFRGAVMAIYGIFASV
jgi:hypothetical protein